MIDRPVVYLEQFLRQLKRCSNNISPFMYCTCTLCKIWQHSSTRLHYKELTRREIWEGRKGELREKDIVQYVSERLVSCFPLFSITEAFIDFCRAVVFFGHYSWWLYCRSASLTVVALYKALALANYFPVTYVLRKWTFIYKS